MAQVPAEFIGQARGFIQRATVHQVAYATGANRILAPVRAMLATQPPSPRLRGMVERRWQALPATGRLALTVTSANGTLTITEMFVTTGSLTFEAWGTGQQASALLIYSVRGRINAAWSAQQGRLLAGISLHAMARRFQRSLDCSDAAIKADCLALAVAVQQCAPAAKAGDFIVPGADGRWVGTWVQENDGDFIRAAARTFITPDMPVAAELTTQATAMPAPRMQRHL